MMPSAENAMIYCTHSLIEWERHDEGMHCLGWVCRSCGYIELGECHHETWCRTRDLVPSRLLRGRAGLRGSGDERFGVRTAIAPAPWRCTTSGERPHTPERHNPIVWPTIPRSACESQGAAAEGL